MLFDSKEQFETHVADIVRVMKEYHGSRWTLRESIVVGPSWVVTGSNANFFNSFEAAFNFLVDMEWIAQLNEHEYNK